MSTTKIGNIKHEFTLIGSCDNCGKYPRVVHKLAPHGVEGVFCCEEYLELDKVQVETEIGDLQDDLKFIEYCFVLSLYTEEEHMLLSQHKELVSKALEALETLLARRFSYEAKVDGPPLLQGGCT